MVFKRRNKPSAWSQIRNFFWPSMGWKRSFLYIKHRTIRLNASNYAVAAGLAFGCSISFVPTLGFHIIQCFFLCLLFRANFLASILGTVIGNPWTFPFLFLISYKVGWFILNGSGLDIPFDNNVDLSFKALNETPWDLFMPLLIGGYVTAFVTFPLFYLGFYTMVKTARRARQHAIEKNKR